MRHSETISAFFQSSSLYQKKAGRSCDRLKPSNSTGFYLNYLSIYDRLYALKPKKPVWNLTHFFSLIAPDPDNYRDYRFGTILRIRKTLIPNYRETLSLNLFCCHTDGKVEIQGFLNVLIPLFMSGFEDRSPVIWLWSLKHESNI